MSDNQQGGSSEPTMEEILSSIRRIISDEDQPAEVPVAAKQPPPPPPPAKAQAPAPDPFDDIVIEEEEPAAPAPEAKAVREDVLELTQIVNDDGTVTDIDEMEAELVIGEEEPVMAAPPPRPAAPLAPAPAPAEPIMGELEANLAAAALNQLVVEMPKFIGIGQGLTLEEITKELLRPMLKQWLDAYLPATVERLVQEEIARVSRLHR
ncbi:MAG: DUF2497 domain-containing protein [Pseudomonadota bacterium]